MRRYCYGVTDAGWWSVIPSVIPDVP